MRKPLNPAIPALMQPAARLMRESLPQYSPAKGLARPALTATLPDHGDGGKTLWKAYTADVHPLRKRG